MAAVAAGRRVNLDIGTDPVTVLADPLSLREAASKGGRKAGNGAAAPAPNPARARKRSDGDAGA